MQHKTFGIPLNRVTSMSFLSFRCWFHFFFFVLFLFLSLSFPCLCVNVAFKFCVVGVFYDVVALALYAYSLGAQNVHLMVLSNIVCETQTKFHKSKYNIDRIWTRIWHLQFAEHTASRQTRLLRLICLRISFILFVLMLWTGDKMLTIQ